MTKAELAKRVACMTREAAAVSAALAEGMWNPDFCSSDAADYAIGFLQDMRSHLDHIEKRLDESASEAAPKDP